MTLGLGQLVQTQVYHTFLINKFCMEFAFCSLQHMAQNILFFEGWPGISVGNFLSSKPIFFFSSFIWIIFFLFICQILNFLCSKSMHVNPWYKGDSHKINETLRLYPWKNVRFLWLRFWVKFIIISCEKNTK